MDDVIKLLKLTYASDEEGNQIANETARQVFCKVESVTRSEYYQAAQVDMHPSYVFMLSNYRDYQGERELLYTDWTGVEKRYVITRTYKFPEQDGIELTTEERVGVNE